MSFPSRISSIRRHLDASPLGSRLAQGAFWAVSGALISRTLGLLSTILVGRILGARGFGQLGMLQATVGLFGTVAGFGLGMGATKYVAEFRSRDPARAGRILALSSATSWLSGALMAALLAAAAPWVAARALAAPDMAGLLRFGSWLLLFNTVNAVQAGSLAGFEAFKTLAALSLLSGVLSFPLTLWSAVRFGVPGVLGGLIAGAALNCAFSAGALRTRCRAERIPRGDPGALGEWRIFLDFNLPGVLNSLLLAFSGWACAAWLAQQPGGYAGLGVLNAIKRLQQIPEALVTTAMAPLLPVLSEAYARKDLETYNRAVAVAFFSAALLILPFALVQLGCPWLTLLPYGNSYTGGEAVVQWLMLGSLASGLLWPLGTILISLGRLWYAFRLVLLNTVLFLIFGWLWVPKFGAAGYAAAWAGAFIFGNAPSVRFLYTRVHLGMRQVRWGGMLAMVTALAAVCVISGRIAPGWLALLVAFAAALAFAARQVLVYRIELRARACTNHSGDSIGSPPPAAAPRLITPGA